MSEQDDEFARAQWGTEPPSVTASLIGIAGWSPPLPPPPPPPLGAPPRTPRRGGFVGFAIVVAVLLLLGGALVGWLRGGYTGTGRRSDAKSVDAARRLSAGIVDIETFTYGAGGIGGSQVPLGAGTGMVLTSSGEVLTNNHVIRGATRIQVTIPGRSGTFSATVLGADPTADVALIKIDAVSGLPTESFGDSSKISVGSRVTALGNALGRGGPPSVTRGAVSALDRSISVSDDQGGIEHLSGLLQMSAAISPGESGGAVVDDAGQVIGMITAAASRGPQQPVSTIGFAIPANAALEVAHQIQSGQASADAYIGPTGFLGVEISRLSEGAASRVGVGPRSGVLVVGIVNGSPAEQIGISAGSVITAIDGRQIRSLEALGPAIQSHASGDSISVTWVDSNGSHTASASLISGPAI